MPRYEFSEGTSNKFWQIEREGNALTVTYGRIGAAKPTVKTKDYADEAAAQKDMEKQIASKTKKGYQLADGGAAASGGGGGGGAASDGFQRFEFVEGTSSKFWEVKCEGNSVTVRYGKIGAAKPTTKTKEHKDAAAAQKDMEKQIASKTKKGYVAATGGGGGAAAAAASGGKTALVGLEKESLIGYEHPKKFVHRGIVAYKPGKPGLSQAAKGKAYRVACDDFDQTSQEFLELVGKLGEDPQAGQLKALVIGCWGGEDTATGEGGDEVVDAIAKLAAACPELEAIFLGDIIQEECEVSWIQLGDWAKIVNAFPKLEHFRVRGVSEANPLKNESLRSLCVQAGCSRKDAQSVAASHLPELEHLELWLGTDEYGGDVQVEDLMPILSGKLFPKLRYLGLRNAQLADQVAQAVATAPILDRIETLDLSLGVLTDAGGEALLASPAVAKLKRLDLHYNFLSDGVAKKLRKLGPQVDTARGEADEDSYGDEVYRFVAVGE